MLFIPMCVFIGVFAPVERHTACDTPRNAFTVCQLWAKILYLPLKISARAALTTFWFAYFATASKLLLYKRRTAILRQRMHARAPKKHQKTLCRTTATGKIHITALSKRFSFHTHIFYYKTGVFLPGFWDGRHFFCSRSLVVSLCFIYRQWSKYPNKTFINVLQSRVDYGRPFE